MSNFPASTPPAPGSARASRSRGVPTGSRARPGTRPCRRPGVPRPGTGVYDAVAGPNLPRRREGPPARWASSRRRPVDPAASPPESERAGAGREEGRAPGDPQRLGRGPRPASGSSGVPENRVEIGASGLHPCPAIRRRRCRGRHRPTRSLRSVRNPRRPASPGDRSRRSACHRDRRPLQGGRFEGRTGRRGDGNGQWAAR